MANRYSVANGNWNSTAVWSATVGGAPGASVPISGDTAVIYGGKTVTVNVVAPILNISMVGGNLVVAAGKGITFDDGGAIVIDDASTFTSQGTAASMCLFSGANVNSNWTILVSSGTNAYALVFDYLEMRNNLWVLGDSTNRLLANYYGDSTKPWMLNVTPLARDPIMIEHPIDGRATSRIYPRGGHAGTVTVTGWFPMTMQSSTLILRMQASNLRLHFFSRYVHLPKCRIAGKPSFAVKPGQLKVDFSINLIEDL